MILRGSVFSKILEMETGISVIAPNEFKTDSKYQVVYLLHGLCGNSGDWIDYTMLPAYAGDFNVIFVMPAVARSFYADMKYGQKFYSYVSDELPQICRSIFNISAKREETAVIGASMGGYGALKCALSKPEQYGYCCAFSSPCLFIKEFFDNHRAHGNDEEFRKMYGEQLLRDFKGAFGENLQCTTDDDILELAGKINIEKIKPEIYLACGTEDYLHGENIRFRDEMKKYDLKVTYEEWTGNHDWYFFNEALRRSLKFCFTKPE